MANLPKGLRSAGRDIFTDAKGNTYILNETRTRILLLDQSFVVFFQLYRSRLVLGAVIALVIGYYGGNWALGIAVGVLLFCAFELIFRQWVRPQLSTHKKLKEPYPTTGLIAGIHEQSKDNLLKNVVLSLIMCGIFTWNLIEQTKVGFSFTDINGVLNTVLSIVMIVGPALYGVLCAREFFGR